LKHVWAIILKFIMVAVISAVILPFFGQISLTDTLIIAAVVTVITYVLWDLLLLPRYGNWVTTIADGIVDAILIALAPLVLPITVNIYGIILTAVVLAVGEWFFHRYLAMGEVVPTTAEKREEES